MEETNQQTTPKPPSKFNSHKVWATIGVILIAVIVILGILALIYRDRVNDYLASLLADNSTVSVTKMATSSATATNSATISATKGWKTYTSDTYKFSFKYPDTWKVKSESSNNITLSKGTTELSYSLVDPGIDATVTSKEIVKVGSKDVQFNFYTVNSGDKKATFSTYSSGSVYSIQKSGSVYSIYVIAANSDFDTDWAEVKTILSTFKFL